MNANLDHSRMEGEPWRSDRRSVLIADDNAFFQEALMITLKVDKRIEIAGRAQHGREAVELASSLQPDVVLMDLDMPVLDGIEATRGVLQVSPATQVVVLTASSSADDERRARAAGADAYLRKGCPMTDLFDAIFAEPPSPDRRQERSVSFLRLGFSIRRLISIETARNPGLRCLTQ